MGYRTFVEQDHLYMKGRTIPGPVVTKAQAGESAHNWGCAVDLTVFDILGRPVWDHNKWATLGEVSEKLGLVWGGDWKFKDKPHVELDITCKWTDVLAQYLANGEKAAYNLIKNKVRK